MPSCLYIYLMHLNYYYLCFVTEELKKKLNGFQLAECYLQNRYECILAFHDGKEEFFIKLNLYQEFTCLAFPKEFFKNKKGTYPVFKELIGLKVQDVRMHENDRSFHISFENEFSLMFKLYGSRSNLLLFYQNNCIDLLNKKLSADTEIDLGQTDKIVEQNFETFINAHGNLKKVFPAFDKGILEELELKAYAQKTPEKQWKIIGEILEVLHRKIFFILEREARIVLSFFNRGKLLEESSSALEAANQFERWAGQRFYFEHEKQEALNHLQLKLKKTHLYLANVQQKLKELGEQIRYDEIANILMANLHQIPKHAQQVELFNFYTDSTIVIRLKKELSPQKNAENYYRKAKNQKLEIAELGKNIAVKQEELERLTRQYNELGKFTNLKDLRKYLKAQNLEQSTNTKEKKQENLFRRFEVDGFEILIGKSAKNNDLLTQRYSFKEDLWLHARDVAGSHVLIKYKAGKIFPKRVIEKAAQLAAYYSKRRNDSLCPVIVTPKKFVRKPKGALEGQVIVEREEVLLVKPAAYN